MERRAMDSWLGLAARIDRLNERIGAVVSWLVLLMVLVGAYNAVARYLGRSLGVSLSSNAYIELQWYAFSLVFLLGAAYTLRHGGHVRVDVLYGRLSPRGKAWTDLVGTVVFLLPFCAFAIWISWPSIRNSWAVLEGSPDPGGLPRYPLKSMIPVAFVLLAAQGVAGMIRSVATLRGYDPGDPSRAGESE
jgi:TRAP-type mannitol/chloroaromatic compound transport system permease small subunit